MVKELFLAIFLGLFLGFALTGSIMGLLKTKNTKTIANQKGPTPTVVVTTPSADSAASPTGVDSSDSLSITQPEDESLVDNSQLTIKGTTISSASIVVMVNNTSYTAKSDANGNFQVPVKLDSGINAIQVAVVGQDNSPLQKQFTVTYSTAKI